MSELALRLRQPAQVGDRSRSDFVAGTRDYLPGTVVRGGFAAAWIATYGEPVPSSPSRTQFLRLFEGGVRFGPLFCGPAFMPLSVLGHKYDPGDRCTVVEYDRALKDDDPERCLDCGSPLEQAKGLGGTGVRVRRRTSVAITPAGVARRGQIVTRDTLEAEQVFRGTLIASSPDLLDALAGIGP